MKYYTNRTGDTHAIALFPDGSALVNNAEVFSSEAVAIRYCDCETIYGDEAGQTMAYIALYGNPEGGWTPQPSATERRAMNAYIYAHLDSIAEDATPERLAEYSESARRLAVVAGVARALSLPFTLENVPSITGQHYVDIAVTCDDLTALARLLEGLRSNRFADQGIVCGHHVDDAIAEMFADVCIFAT